MASCAKCGAALITRARFCATCGTPVASASVAPPPDPAAGRAKEPTDPFAKTVLGGQPEPAVANLASPAVSPMAASVMANVPPQKLPSVPPGRVSANPPAREPPRQSTEYAPPLPVAAHPFAPGSLVLVWWADGNRYPGTVLQAAPHHVFVAFPNGVQQWIDVRYVTSGG